MKDQILLNGNSKEVLVWLENDTVDSVVCDPPYEIGFMGKSWDSTGIAYDVDLWKEVLRVLKPGGHLLAFGGSRTYHRMACAIEDAGFEIRDMIEWIYGSGFPKGQDVGKAVDKVEGKNGIQVGVKKAGLALCGNNWVRGVAGGMHEVPIIQQESALGIKWEGWGTVLKPAHEPIIMARKPFKGTVAANVLKYGTGALNIGACRVGEEKVSIHNAPKGTFAGGEEGRGSDTSSYKESIGRYPANLIHDGSEEVLELFPNSKESAARFFYCAKPSKKERNLGCEGLEEIETIIANPNNSKETPGQRVVKARNNHPTVKPLALMTYLIQLVTPPDGIVLDPFCGSGTTLLAAKKLGIKATGIDLQKEYINIAKARLTEGAQDGPKNNKE